MPHFFFDTDDGNFRNVDSEGFELSGIEAARIEALAALPDMARNRLPDGDRRTYSVRVRDEDGRVTYFASLDLVGEWHIPRAGS